MRAIDLDLACPDPQTEPMNQSPLLILVTGDPVPAVHREIGDFATLIERAMGQAWSGAWHRVDARHVEPRGLDWAGVIITGSPESLTEPRPWMAPALNYVRSIVETGVPTFGICFGHQMLGAALGAVSKTIREGVKSERWNFGYSRRIHSWKVWLRQGTPRPSR